MLRKEQLKETFSGHKEYIIYYFNAWIYYHNFVLVICKVTVQYKYKYMMDKLYTDSIRMTFPIFYDSCFAITLRHRPIFIGSPRGRVTWIIRIWQQLNITLHKLD